MPEETPDEEGRRSMEIARVDVGGGVTLSVTDDGDGPAILFIHGLGCDSTDWLYQLARFRATRRVIAPDLRGHGRSSVPDGPYDLPSFVADLAAVLGRLGVESCVVVGHSLGGLIAAALAIEHPERVSALVAIDPPWGPIESRELYEALGAVVGQPGALASAFEASDSAMTPAYFREAHRRAAFVTDLAVLERSWQQCLLAPGSLAFDEHALRRRRSPMLVLHSKNHPGMAAWERTVSVHDADRALELPVGHWIHHDLPDQTNELIAEWLGTVEN
jgi:pimeloyl-ACP methyl ester carboxylesterase